LPLNRRGGEGGNSCSLNKGDGKQSYFVAAFAAECEVAMQQIYSQKPWVNSLMKVEHVLARIVDWGCAVILLTMLADMVWQVTCRFVLNLSVPWTDELARYLWISIAYVGAGAAISENNHVEISLIASILRTGQNERKKRMLAQLLDVIRFILLLILSVYLLKLTWPYMLKVKNIGQVSAAMHLPTWILDGVLVFGLSSMVLHTLFRLMIAIVDHGAIIDPIIVAGKGKKA